MLNLRSLEDSNVKMLRQMDKRSGSQPGLEISNWNQKHRWYCLGKEYRRIKEDTLKTKIHFVEMLTFKEMLNKK